MDVSEFTKPQSCVLDNSMQFGNDYDGTLVPLLEWDFDSSKDSYSQSVVSKLCRSVTCWCVCPVTVSCGIFGIVLGNVMYGCASVLDEEECAQGAGCDICAVYGKTAINNTWSWIGYSYWCCLCK